MKVWLKLLLGTSIGLLLGLLPPLPIETIAWIVRVLGFVLGLGLAFMFPASKPIVKAFMGVALGLVMATVLNVVLFNLVPNLGSGNILFGSLLVPINDFILSLGRYALFPLVFFSTAVALSDLHRDKRLWPVLGRSLSYMVLGTLILVLVGALFVLLLSPERIPITSLRETELIFRSWNDTLTNLVPKNLFQVLTGGADFLLPVYLLSFILGLHFPFDRRVTEPAVTLFDSLSRIFYHLNSFVVEIMGFGMIVLAAAWMTQLRLVQNIQVYYQFFLVLSLATVFVVFVVLPALLWFFGGRENPYKWIFGAMGAGLGAFFSGDSFFSLGIATRLTRENLGVPRKVGALNLPLFAMFGRAGTALTSTIAFIILLRSYFGPDISLEQLGQTVFFAFVLSFTLPSVPGLGAYINLSLLCSLYGRSLDNGFLTMQPVLPVLVSFSALLDVYVASLAALLVARHEKLQKVIPAKLYI